ncbi:hypothetical protein BBO_06511 [Beauveria brongniartii RCEF 3172]|uniref:Uncharacterized protein n=1 Tax=Beauveria brongniartii RCEF 3172 TaxID=1081107 RepID=A0A167B152_9HYPO|nr:hypothetical protein BBO_06511 [Beauveria brongniartii RCEF 3172]
MLAVSRQFSTVDGHNPEIIYHILENQDEFGPKPTYQALDNELRCRGTSNQQALVMMEAVRREEDDATSRAPSRSWEGPVDFPQSPLSDEYPEALGSANMSEDEAGIYGRLMERLTARESVDLGKDTDDILDRDYFNGVHQIYRAKEIVRHMTTERDGKSQNFSPHLDKIRAELEAAGEPMVDGPFDIRLPDPVTPGKVSRQRVTLPHVYLPGWAGRPCANLRNVDEWKYAIKLAEGRYHKFCLFYEGINVALSEMAIVLGFPSMHTFAHFIHRPEIKEAFRELWDAALKNLPGDKQLAQNKDERRPVALRILYSRGLEGGSEFEDKHPNKRDWPLESHLARFCLKVESVCNRWKLPPMRGQIPMLAGKAPTSVVAWGGVELARLLRRMQKGYGSRIRYLDQDPPM